MYPHEILAQNPSLHQISMVAEGNLELSREELDLINLSEIIQEISLIPSFPPASLILSGKLMAGVVKIYHKKLKLLEDDLERRILVINSLESTVYLNEGRTQANLEFDAFDDDFDSEEDDGITESSTEPAKDELIKVESSIIKERDAQPH